MLPRRDQLEVRKQELQARRTQMLTSIDAGFISRYEAMRRAKQGRAVSKVEQNSCQWCRVILTPSELQRVRISKDLQSCSNCGRILYFDRGVLLLMRAFVTMCIQIAPHGNLTYRTQGRRNRGV